MELVGNRLTRVSQNALVEEFCLLELRPEHGLSPESWGVREIDPQGF